MLENGIYGGPQLLRGEATLPLFEVEIFMATKKRKNYSRLLEQGEKVTSLIIWYFYRDDRWYWELLKMLLFSYGVILLEKQD
jgi:hypothetical protein